MPANPAGSTFKINPNLATLHPQLTTSLVQAATLYCQRHSHSCSHSKDYFHSNSQRDPLKHELDQVTLPLTTGSAPGPDFECHPQSALIPPQPFQQAQPLLPQGLCTGCSRHLEYSSPHCVMALAPICLRSLLKSHKRPSQALDLRWEAPQPALPILGPSFILCPGTHPSQNTLHLPPSPPSTS